MRTSKPYSQIAPKLFHALLALQEQVDASGLEPELVQIVALRASQINGCAFCLGYHTQVLRKLGADLGRLETLAGWRDDPAYTPRERAALAWTETLTRLADNGAQPEPRYAELAAHFDEKEIVALTMEVGVINTWNRLNVGLGNPPPKR